MIGRTGTCGVIAVIALSGVVGLGGCSGGYANRSSAPAGGAVSGRLWRRGATGVRLPEGNG